MTLFELELPKAYEKEYLNKIRPGLIKRITKGVGDSEPVILSDAAIEILIPGYSAGSVDYSVLDRLLVGEPQILVKEHTRITKEFAKLQDKDRPSNPDIIRVFDYKGQFDNSKSKAYWLSKLIQSPTCCYCNRQYVFTIERNVGGNDKDRIARPAFDHWFPKKLYPLLSISLYNLIPSCTVCNSSAKGENDMSLTKHIHPYVHRPQHPKIKFVAEPATEADRNWTIAIKRGDKTPEDNTIKMFCLDEIYKMHDKLELKDLMDFIDNYPDGYLSELIKMLENAKLDSSALTRKDIYKMLFGVDYDDDKHLDRPFGKMKNDILKEYL